MKPTTTVGAGCLAIQNDQVLLVKPNYGKAKNCWILPGGFVDAGELISAAAIRELKEETNVDGEILRPFCVRYRLSPSDIYWVFLTKILNDQTIKIDSSEIIEARYLSIKEVLARDDVRPMTKYFIESAVSQNRHQVSFPKEFINDNFVYFINS